MAASSGRAAGMRGAGSSDMQGAPCAHRTCCVIAGLDLSSKLRSSPAPLTCHPTAGLNCTLRAWPSQAKQASTRKTKRMVNRHKKEPGKDKD
mmetsp:Transcript_26370/g.48301  ORF Transcript_26370/g.48301 Transcript_26370/m.48301 type:complete len:92 (+) Transcript_26370:1279-1554(+)